MKVTRIALPLVALLLAVLPLAPAGGATTINVSTTADELNADGGCSLREAIKAANTDLAVDACPAGAGDDTIVLGPGTFTLSVTGINEEMAATGDLDLRTSMTIVGAGASSTIVDGGGIDRVFELPFGVGPRTARMSGLTIRNGRALSDRGGGIKLDDDGTVLELTDAIVSGNTAGQGGGGIDGNRDATSLVLLRVRITGNLAGDSPPTMSASGGGIEADGSLTLTDGVVQGNTATSSGGGIETSGPAVITRTRVAGNAAGTLTTGSGGGLSLRDPGPISISDTEVSGNSSDNGGGGIDTNTDGTITNVTISGNTDDYGGGVSRGGGNLTLMNVTIFGNTARNAGQGGGISNFGPASEILTLRSTIVAGNSGDDCDLNKPITSQGGNISSDATCGFAQPADRPSTDPKLRPLGNNGGPTMTRALRKGSPAIGRGIDCPGADQRGAPRRDCDSGAYEMVFCQGVLVNRVGTSGDDRLRGTARADGILGLDGKDLLIGLRGGDGLCGGRGRDVLRGNRGIDRFDGGLGRDRCIGGPGTATFRRCEIVP